jgi:hypothetical protein
LATLLAVNESTEPEVRMGKYETIYQAVVDAAGKHVQVECVNPSELLSLRNSAKVWFKRRNLPLNVAQRGLNLYMRSGAEVDL